MASLLSGTAVAKLVNEGYDKAKGDQELPIDINYQRLAEWLTSRQKLPADWHKRVTAIQAKASQAVKELPLGLLSQLPGGTDVPVDYFRAKQIRDKLAESADRTLFGALTGQAGTWDQIVKAYEKGGVFIGEAAHSMVQNVDYEIPYLRKQAAKHNTVITDADRKVAEYERSAASCAATLKQECQKLGIEGANVRQELRALGRQLPGMLQDVIHQLRDGQLEAATAFYKEFIRYAHSNASSDASVVEMLTTLAEVREGRTAASAPDTTNGAPDASAAATSAAVGIDWGDLGGSAGDAAADAAPAPAVDWDFGDGPAASSSGIDEGAAAAPAGGGIDWDLDLGPLDAGTSSIDDTSAAAPVDIRWDVTAEGRGEGAGSHDVAGGSGPAISWDIEMTEAAGATAAAESAGRDGGDGVVGTNDGGADAAGIEVHAIKDAAVLRLEHDSDYRSRLMDDLQELRAFLLQRRAELGGGELLQTLLPEAIQSVDKAAVTGMLAAVDGAIGRLNGSSLRQLSLITSSQRYLDRLVGSLQRKAGQEAKMLAATAEVAARKQEARAALVGLQPKVAELVERTKSIKMEVEAALSAAFAPRRVLILGEINNVLLAAQ